MGTKLQKNVSICLLGKSKCFDDVILPLYFSLNRLGYTCRIINDSFYEKSTNIIFGLCEFPNLDVLTLPEDCVIYNLEQIIGTSSGGNPGYIKGCSLLPVWDYSLENVRRFSALGVTSVRYVPFGYSPEMTRIDPKYPKDIDVLFYGALNTITFCQVTCTPNFWLLNLFYDTFVLE